MSRKALKSNSLQAITLVNQVYTLYIQISKEYIKSEDYYFLLSNRHTEEEVILQCKKLEVNNNFCLFEVLIKFDYSKNLFASDNSVWDLYFVTSKNEAVLKHRIKNELSELYHHTIVLPEYSKLFYPYTTNKGNLSFNLNELVLFASFNDISITEDGLLTFSGQYCFPLISECKSYPIIDMYIIVENSVTNDQDQVVVQPTRQKLINKNNQMMTQSSFTGSLDLTKYVVSTQKNHLKFYLQLSYKENEIIKSIKSLRMHVSNNLPLKIRKIINYNGNGKKMKITIKTTKYNKYVAATLSDYQLTKEVAHFFTTSWVKIRRSKLLKEVYKLIFAIIGLLPTKKNLVMFESFHGKQFSDSPRAIYEYMQTHNLDYHLYWSVDRRHMHIFKDKDVKYVRRFSLKWLLLMTSAKYWITNSRLPLWIPKPKNTIYVQTWHGTPLKRLAADMEEVHMPGTNTEKYKENFLKESSKWDYLVSPNAYSTEIFTRAFNFKKQLIESGYPRNDILYTDNNEAAINKIKSKLQLPLDKKIILYAPTWRDNQFYSKGKYKFNLELDLEKMKNELGDEYIVILRMHYLVAENLDLAAFSEFAYDFSYHEDIRELYLISDLLITDYSSVFFDFANLQRPMIFFVYDIEEYRDNLRGFYFDFEKEAPGLLTKSTDEIIAEVKRLDCEGFTPTTEIEAFYEKFCYLEKGESTKRVVEEIFKERTE